MTIVDYISPLVPPKHIKAKGDLAILRERILQSIMLVIAGAAILAFIALGTKTAVDGDWGAFAWFAFLTVITCTGVLFRQLPYKLRASLVPILIFGSGIYSFISAGLNGDGKLYMLGFSVLTGILLGLVPGISALAISVMTMALFGLGMVNGWIPVPPANWMESSTNPTGWIISTIFLAVLGALSAISLALLVNNLTRSLTRQRGLTDELAFEQSSLQERIEQRTTDLQRRVNQIRTAAEVSRSIGSLQQTEELYGKVVNLVRESFDLYYVGLFVVEQGNFAVLKAGTGEAGHKMVNSGHRLSIGGNSMIGWSIMHQEPRIALDIGSEPVRFNNPHLPDTRSELALPIIGNGKVLGALSIQSRLPEAFDQDDILVVKGIADSLAISMQNSFLMGQIQSAFDEIQMLNKAYLEAGWIDAQSTLGSLHYTFENNSVSAEEGSHYIQVPLTLRDQVIGQITLETNSPKLAAEEVDLVEAISTQTALALENARLIYETQRKAQQEESLNNLSLELSKGMNIEDILVTAVREIGKLPEISEVSVHLLPPDEIHPAPHALGGNGNGHKPEVKA